MPNKSTGDVTASKIRSRPQKRFRADVDHNAESQLSLTQQLETLMDADIGAISQTAAPAMGGNSSSSVPDGNIGGHMPEVEENATSTGEIHSPEVWAALGRRRAAEGVSESNEKFSKISTGILKKLSILARAARPPPAKQNGIVADTELCVRQVGTIVEAYSVANPMNRFVMTKETLRLAVGAVGVHQMRLVDCSQREHVHLMYIIIGKGRLRSHEGALWTLDKL